MTAESAPKAAMHIYFVDNVRYETEHSSLTGGQIKAQIPNFDPSYMLFLEEPGDKADLLITDDMTVDLAKEKGPRRLYTVPPATFGS
jgi:hypothetical protein